MNFFGSESPAPKVVLLFAFLHVVHGSFSQKPDSIRTPHIFSGSISATNNGISIVPSFSLDKPAVIFNLSMGKKRFSIDPDIRFSMAGRPWSFLFWARYKVVTASKFQLNAGTHLGLNFKTSVLPVNGDSAKLTVTRRYLAGELFPRYLITKNFSIGIYYLYSHGIDPGTIKNTNFLTFQTNFSHIKLPKTFYLRFTPQLYYLKLDQQDGFYFTATTTLAMQNFPLSVSAIVNKIIRSNIAGSKNFVWNVSLVYSFNKKYVEQ